MPIKGKAPTSTRTLWKGAITFGLVHIPIGLYSATADTGLNFDWIDKRTMDPVGYKRINKNSGKEVRSEDIVKGIEFEDGRYVILSADEIAAAFPKVTQTIEIEAFVKAGEIPFVYLEKPYYVSPINRGSKVYTLLREAMKDANVVGVAKVVIASKQHLAVLIPCGPALILNLLRWGDEVRSWEGLALPEEGASGLKDSERTMAKQLITEMMGKWDPASFTDVYREQVMSLVEEKAKAGKVSVVNKPGIAEAPAGAEIVDLAEMLKRSLQSKGRKPAPASGSKGATVQALPVKTSPARKKRA